MAGADDVLAVQFLGADRAAREIDVVVVAHGRRFYRNDCGSSRRRRCLDSEALHCSGGGPEPTVEYCSLSERYGIREQLDLGTPTFDGDSPKRPMTRLGAIVRPRKFE